jgi:hypothetical protein
MFGQEHIAFASGAVGVILFFLGLAKLHYSVTQRVALLEEKDVRQHELEVRVRVLESGHAALAQEIKSGLDALHRRQDNHVESLAAIRVRIDTLLERLG